MTDKPEDTGTAARMLVSQMQRERRSFWGILTVFFLLLAGIGGMLGYQIFALRTFTEDSRARRFQEIGSESITRSDLRTAQDNSAVKQREIMNQTVAAQNDTEKAWRALKAQPDALVQDAVRYAKQHFLGRPLNQSTAMVVFGALESKRLTASQRALLKAAQLDWSIPSSMLTDTIAPEQLDPKWPEIQANAAVLLNDPALKYYGYVARGAYYFRKVTNGGLEMEPKAYMYWDNGCDHLVEEASKALEAGSGLGEGAAPEASGLNLHYWRGQCWRRHGEPYLAVKEFEAMMRGADSDALSPTNPLKYQAFHGMGTVMTTLLDMDAKPDEQRKAEAEDARKYLEQAGKFRMAAGATKVGEVNSTGNIGFLLLKDDTPAGLVKVLDQTTVVDELLPSTWNLVAQLTAVRALQALDPDARDAVAGEKYSEDALDEIAFRTLAELAYQPVSSLPEKEFRNILDKKHHPVLDEVVACIGKKQECYKTAYAK
jgi:hypothetical protein